MIATSKNKILEVYVAARIFVQRYGHTKKFAKHIVALVIKEQENLTDEELAEFMAVNPRQVLSYKRKPNPSTFSKVKQTLRYDNVIPVIARNGRRFRKSEEPKDKDYKKRWAIERVLQG